MVSLTLPLTEEKVRLLNCGDLVTLTGTIYTARDAVHKYLDDGGKLPIDIAGSAIYHCGPVTVQVDNEWKIEAAGPTTSIREEPYTAMVIEKFGVKAIIGKGGMGPKTLAACQEFGCVYLSAYGGCAQLLADKITKVSNVFFYDEFGAPEAIWQLEVVDFPAVVTMDSKGKSLHQRVEDLSKENLLYL